MRLLNGLKLFLLSFLVLAACSQNKGMTEKQAIQVAYDEMGELVTGKKVRVEEEKNRFYENARQSLRKTEAHILHKRGIGKCGNILTEL